MKLDRHIIDLLTLLEKATDTPSYTFIPQLIREELVEIRWKPIFTHDERGYLVNLSHEIEVIYKDDEKKDASK